MAKGLVSTWHVISWSKFGCNERLEYPSRPNGAPTALMKSIPHSAPWSFGGISMIRSHGEGSSLGEVVTKSP